MSDQDVFVWRCERGHETAHSELEIRAMRVHPMCPWRVDAGVCGARLTEKVRRLEALSERGSE